ncbi:hypothetical protein G6F57_005993 [Rhizopus arrhizus]|uniref:Uncharacterized protein n=1 Tax=Rhizopus oryzae TaxID=64495 RepID=A0A9P7BW52_RHIOR|nr:hypothetical protein G6F23_002910 [Rhizopus arrhizus]KAG1424384.1 hypothetical protein G6F58_002406 [Rhizopus delemar]KAG0792496.1 hypothetical protein G6F21_004316 [Rhizopus arrhizus]KAG0817604.1 hypothetical protein G6F20_002246 [Rhizopus arrhizus]KAG0841654.1 hypothetical protein G6F19_001430 [Rhizopus arrhizus]
MLSYRLLLNYQNDVFVRFQASYYSFCINHCSNSTYGWGVPSSQFTLISLNEADENFIYPQPLAKQLAQVTNSSNWASDYDVAVDINHDIYMNNYVDDNWNGTGIPASGGYWFTNDSESIEDHQIDIEYVILHQMIHGLGMTTSWASYFYDAASPFHLLLKDVIEPEESLKVVTPNPHWRVPHDGGPVYITGFQPNLIFDKFLTLFFPAVNRTDSLAEIGFEMQNFCVQDDDTFIVNFMNSFLNNATQSYKAMSMFVSMSTPQTLKFQFVGTNAQSTYYTNNYLNKTYEYMQLYTGSNTSCQQGDYYQPGIVYTHLDQAYSSTPDFLMTGNYVQGKKLTSLIDEVYSNITITYNVTKLVNVTVYNKTTVNNYTTITNKTIEQGVTIETLYKSAIGPGVLRILETIGYSTVLTNTNYTADIIKSNKPKSTCSDNSNIGTDGSLSNNGNDDDTTTGSSSSAGSSSLSNNNSGANITKRRPSQCSLESTTSTNSGYYPKRLSLTGSESISFVVDKCMSPFRRRSSNASSVVSFNIEIETKKLFEIYQLALDELNYAEDSRGSLYYSGDRVAAKEAIEHCVEAYQLILEQSVTLEQQDKLKSTIAYRQSGWKNLYFALRNPSVYTWGENFDQRLGLSSFEEETQMYLPASRHRRLRVGREVAEPQEVHALKGKGIIDLVSGGWSFHALDRYGHVWFWGTMQADISPRDSIGTERVKTPIKLERDVHDEKRVKFKSISSGRGHGIGLAQDGTVWHWSNHRVIQKVDLVLASSNVIQVTANWSFSSVLTEEGTVIIIPPPDNIIYSEAYRQPSPTIATSAVSSHEILPGDQVIQLAGLEDYTLALTKFGRVLKLATKDYASFSINPQSHVTLLRHFGAPQKELNDRQGKMKRFITGAFQSFAVYTDEGEVLLGDIHATEDTEPRRLSGLDHQQVVKVSFGDYHYGALTSKGKLMTWGQYSSGALGQGRDQQNLDTPHFVESLKEKYTIAIGFGGWQSSALVIDLKE